MKARFKKLKTEWTWVVTLWLRDQREIKRNCISYSTFQHSLFSYWSSTHQINIVSFPSSFINQSPPSSFFVLFELNLYQVSLSNHTLNNNPKPYVKLVNEINDMEAFKENPQLSITNVNLNTNIDIQAIQTEIIVIYLKIQDFITFVVSTNQVSALHFQINSLYQSSSCTFY